MKQRRQILTACLLVFGLAAGPAWALSDGIFDQARIGCSCHGGVVPPPNATTRPLILGLPSTEGYVPGETYSLQLVVIGVTVPLGTEARAGFNLEVTGWRLQALDETAVRTRHRSECEVLQSVTPCEDGTDGPSTCGVTTTAAEPDPSCRTALECFVRQCDTPGEGDCRTCRPEIVDVQATHTMTGNDFILWDILWTAPAADTGPVTFHMAGNFVNGDGRNDHDPLDVWSVAPPITVPERN